MSKHVEFIFDFASPNAYLAHQILPEICAQNGATLSYTPCLLGGIFKATNNQAPMIANANIQNKMDYDMLEMRRFIDKHNLTDFRMNPHFPVITLMLMRGAVAAEMDGYLTDYIEKMVACMWEQGLKLDDPEVLHKAYSDAGFDADKLMAQMQDAAVKTKLAENTQSAVERGAFGIPTFFVDGEIYFGKDRLGVIAEALAS